MIRRRGFSMIELVFVLAIVAIVAVIAVASFQATKRNTSLDAVAQDLASQAQGLKMTALAEQRDYLLVLASPPGNDASNCGITTPDACVRAFVLRAPQAAWSISTFDPSAPSALAEYVDAIELPRGIVMDLASTGRAAPAPFDLVTAFPPDVTSPCSTSTCVAVRFGANGEVRPEYRSGAGVPVPTTRAGVSFALTTDELGLKGAAQRRAVLVSFPAGITRIFPL